MGRRYYLAKFAVLVVAVALAVAGSGMGEPRTPGAIGAHATYSAPAQLQHAAWHATNSAARLVACLASRALRNLAEIAS